MFNKRTALALLPATRALWDKNKVAVQAFPQYWDKSTVYVAFDHDKQRTIFFVSCGRLDAQKFAVDTWHYVKHDQTHANLGQFQIINVYDVIDGKVENAANTLGVDIKAPVWVFK